MRIWKIPNYPFKETSPEWWEGQVDVSSVSALMLMNGPLTHLNVWVQISWMSRGSLNNWMLEWLQNGPWHSYNNRASLLHLWSNSSNASYPHMSLQVRHCYVLQNIHESFECGPQYCINLVYHRVGLRKDVGLITSSHQASFSVCFSQSLGWSCSSEWYYICWS